MMKKRICFVLVLMLLVGCLTACSFTANTTSSLPGKVEKTPQVEEMLTALAENKTEEAKALMHPQVAEKADAALAQMSAYLAGRTVTDLAAKSTNVRTSTGTSGKMRQEQVAYQVTLTDGEVIYFNTLYLTNDAGSGFATFQLVLGVV